MNYSIIKELGQGGMATVFLAEDKKFQTQVALKVLNKELAYNENIRKRFLAEARNMYRMSHPNIIKVTDLIDEGDTVAFVMEHIDGETLKEFLDRKGKLTDDEIRNIFSQMLEAVGYVHNKGLVHRDIKPSNFMIDREGKVKLLDFGIAKNTDTSSAEYTQTGTGMQMGTPMYMSPEQITETKSVTPQSDIYSLGVVLWQLVTGEKPYNTATLSNFQLQTKIVNEPLSATGSSFDGVIKKATEKDPTLRFTDCEGFKNALSNKASNSGNEKTVFVNSDEKTILNSSNEKTIVQKPELPATYTDEFGIEFILVEAGSFMMGVNSNEAEADEKENAKLVTITKNYYIGKYPVTCAQWLSICDDDPDSFCNYLKHPAEVYFYSGKIDGGYYASVMEFLETINSKSKNKYRLPNSTEWEFAARGGNKSRGYKYAGSNNVDEVAWYHANRTVTKKVEKKALWGLLTIEDEELKSLGSNEVGLKKPNELGLYDMSGNVFEYCQGDSDYFVLRGGDHSNSEKYCRLSYEGKYGGWTESIYAMQNGFRLILVP